MAPKLTVGVIMKVRSIYPEKETYQERAQQPTEWAEALPDTLQTKANI